MVRNSGSVSSISVATPPDALTPNCLSAGSELTSEPGDRGRIPTLPFGTKDVVGPRSAAADDPRAEKEFGPFRFVIKQEQIDATLLARGGNSGAVVAPADDLEGSPRGHWRLLLCAIGVATFACALLFWPETSHDSENATLQRAPALRHRRSPQSLPAPAAPETNGKPGTPIDESQSAVLGPNIAPGPAPNATIIQPESPSRTRLTAAKARATLKRSSVLASVLAPPPAD